MMHQSSFFIRKFCKNSMCALGNNNTPVRFTSTCIEILLNQFFSRNATHINISKIMPISIITQWGKSRDQGNINATVHWIHFTLLFQNLLHIRVLWNLVESIPSCWYTVQKLFDDTAGDPMFS